MKRTRNANKIYNIQNNYFFAGGLVPCAVSLFDKIKNIAHKYNNIIRKNIYSLYNIYNNIKKLFKYILLNLIKDRFVIFIPSNNYIMPLIDDVLYKIDFIIPLRIPKSRRARCFGSYLGSALYE